MGMASSSNSPCAACKFLRRKCIPGCVFAPYFPQDQSSKFANVHRVFGASNVAKLLNELSPAHREDAVNSLAYEADARLQDPVYGCVGYISVLQHRLRQLQHDLHTAKAELATYIGPSAMANALLNPAAAQQLNPLMNPNHPFYQQNHPSLAGAAAHYWTTPAAMGAALQQQAQLGAGPSTGPVQDPQYHSQQIMDPRRLPGPAAVNAGPREQLEMMRNYEQQQQLDLMRFGGGLDGVGGGCSSGGLGGFNQLTGVVTVAGPSTGFGHAGAGPSTGLTPGAGPSTGLGHPGAFTGLGQGGPSTGMVHPGPSTGFGHAGPSSEMAHAGPSTGLALAPQQFDNPFHHQQAHTHYPEQQHQQQLQQQAQHHQLSRFAKEEGVGSSWDGAGRGPSSS